MCVSGKRVEMYKKTQVDGWMNGCEKSGESEEMN